MTLAQIPLLQPALSLAPAVVGAVACTPSAWPVAVAFAIVLALEAAFLWWQYRWARELWPLAARMLTVRSSRVQLHYEPEWNGLVREWDLAGAFARELRHLERVWFGSRLRGGVDVYLLRFLGPVARVTSGFGGMAWARWRIVVAPAEPLGELPGVMRHEFAHLLVPKLGPAEPAFKTEGLCVFLQELGGATPSDFGPWPSVFGRPLAELPPVKAMLDAGYFFDSTNVSACYGAAGHFTHYLVTRFGWPAYREFFRQAHARSYAKAFAAAFGVSLLEAEVDWRAEVEAQSGEVAGGTDVD